jgi:MFS family permease
MTVAEIIADPVKRNVGVLALAQALFHCTQSMAIATTPLAAYSLLGVDKTFATVPIFLTHVALMATTLPAALLMGKVGRRTGFTLGAMLGILGGLISFAAIWERSFVLLCAGSMFQGSAAAFAWHYRFAATDTADPAFRPKAISLVMAGGVLAGLIGPQTAKWSVDLFHPVTFAGVYLMTSLFCLGTGLLVQFIRIPLPPPVSATGSGRPLREIMAQPAFIGAALSSMFGYAVMTLVMSATPLAMLGCGFGFTDSATVIQAHVLAMFIPSFFTGSLIQKFGVHRIIATGAVISIGCALVNLSGIAFANFLVANVLVGLGWNFCYVGGTTLLTTTHTPQERAKVQGINDFLVYGTTATAAALSGTLQAQAGWSVINLVALPLLAAVFVVILWVRRKEATVSAPRAA